MTLTAVASATFINGTIANNHKDAVAGSSVGGIADYGTISMVTQSSTGTMAQIAVSAAR